MTTKNRIAKLEQAHSEKRGDEDNKIHIFLLNEDGSLSTRDAAGNETKYTAAEHAEYVKQCEARGGKIICITPASKDVFKDGDE